MSARPFVIYALTLLTMIGGFAAVGDALVVTDEERLDELVESLVSAPAGERVDRALDFAAPAREPVELLARGRANRFGDGDEVDLANRARQLLAPFEVDGIDVVQRSIDIRGESARVVVRARSGEGYINALFDLRRHGERWLIERLRVS